MKILLSILLTVSAANAATEGVNVINPATQEFVSGPKENFSGAVRVARLVQGQNPSNLNSALVEFSKGVRSNWHTHPKGQLLIITEGTGRVQEWGKPVQKMKKGDVIWTPPGVKHWHGAETDSSMSHLAVQESLDGKTVVWMEPVIDSK